jgi:hydrogenase nickel incorporation protein HypB
MSSVTISVGLDVQAAARRAAADLRHRLRQQRTLVVNLLSSPGSGKTALLEATARHWRGERSLAVLVGDLATDRDAAPLRPHVPVVQLTTGAAGQ